MIGEGDLILSLHVTALSQLLLHQYTYFISESHLCHTYVKPSVISSRACVYIDWACARIVASPMAMLGDNSIVLILLFSFYFTKKLPSTATMNHQRVANKGTKEWEVRWQISRSRILDRQMRKSGLAGINENWAGVQICINQLMKQKEWFQQELMTDTTDEKKPITMY